jgi:hypothetical protein
MIGLTAFDGWSGRKNAAAFMKLGVKAATAPDRPPNLITRRREILPGLFLNLSFSDELLIPAPSQINHTCYSTIAFITRNSSFFASKPIPGISGSRT